MAWQEWASAVLVAGAALYLVRRTWRTWFGRGAGCGGGCGKGCGGEPAKDGTQAFVPAGELTLRRR
jgi:hypothetical protein